MNQIINHTAQAIDRLITQYNEAPNIEAIITAYGTQVQELETMFFGVLNERSIQASVGQQLDNFGTIIGQPRQGFSDDVYRVLLYNRIAQINSEGTIEEVISIFKTLMGASNVIYDVLGPAHISLNAMDVNPLGSYTDIIRAVTNAKPVGVAIDLVATHTGYMGFDGDIDGLGLGDLNNASVGGYLSDLFDYIEIIPLYMAFDGDEDGAGLGDYTNDAIGGFLSEI